MRETRIENGMVKSTMLGVEDHGILTAFLHIDGGGWGCGFGGYSFDTYDKSKEKRVGSAYGTTFIMRVLDVLEVDTWEKLPGTPCRCETGGIGGTITRIGHFMKDKWFDPKVLADELKDQT